MADISTEKLRKQIKKILRCADPSNTSAKKVRMKLEKILEADFSSRKKEIDKLTMSVFMELEEKKKEEEKDDKADEAEAEQEVEEEQNGGNQSDEPQEEEEPEEEPPKKKSKTHESSKKKDKKKKKHRDNEDDDEELEPLENDDLNVYDEEQKTLKLSDEELAKRLQSFEETGRRTRNKGTPKKKERKKSSGGNAYSKPCVLSALLAELMGTDRLARNEVVKKMWEIVKERKLLDPKDRRFVICDDQLQKIFGRKRVQMFVMMKYLGSHVREEGNTLESVITNSDIYDDEADDD